MEDIFVSGGPVEKSMCAISDKFKELGITSTDIKVMFDHTYALAIAVSTESPTLIYAELEYMQRDARFSNSDYTREKWDELNGWVQQEYIYKNIQSALLDQDISALNFTKRIYNLLKRKGINTVRELVAHSHPEDIMRMYHVGEKTAQEITAALKAINVIN